MNRQSRIENIQRILDTKKSDPFGKLEIPWEDDLVSMEVYKIPLESLVYNKFNGRILSRTKSLEKQRKSIDVETEEGRKIIEDLLWESREDRNKQTLHSIKTSGGQQKPGIITRDGIIIDGNRRAMLLRRSGMYDYFKAVILPVTLDENPLEIEKLETSFQMGEDEKLGYNPIEKYLKAQGLYKKLADRSFSVKSIDQKAIEKIALWMGEDIPVVREYLQVMETMEEYLDYLDYQGIYTQLDGREDPFIKLTSWVNNFYGEESSKAFVGYKNDDVDDFKTIAFDYIRIKYEGKKFRYLGNGLKENHFFGDKEIWSSFRDYHFLNKKNIVEEKVDLNSQNLERHLNERDNRFKLLTQNKDNESFLDENFDNHIQKLEYKRAAGQPEKLLKNARRALEAVNQKHRSFATSEVSKELDYLNNFISKMLATTSAEKLLSHIIHLLENIDLEKSTEDPDILMEKVKTIQRMIYQMTKEIKPRK